MGVLGEMDGDGRKAGFGRAVIAAGVALMLSAAAPAASAAPQTATITKRQLREDLPYRTDRRLRDQLWSVFEKENRRRPVPPRAALDAEWLEGKPYATRYSGLCRRDTVALRFAPAAGEAEDTAGAMTPVAAYGIDATRNYRVVAPLAADGEADDRQRPRDSACTRLNREHPFFTATDDDTARDGYLALLAAIDAVGRGVAVTPCERIRIDALSCGAMISGFTADMIQAIASCGEACFIVDIADDRRLTIRRSRDGTVQSIGFESLIVMVHERID